MEDAEKKLGKTVDAKVPKDLEKKVRRVLNENEDLCWDDAVQVVLDNSRLDDLRTRKRENKAKAGNFDASGDDE
jgi:hypothetical protein